MDKFIVKGGHKLSGSIKVEGSKNAALPIIASTILFKKGVNIINNVPPLRDIFTIGKVLEFIGAEFDYDPDKMILKVDCTNLKESIAPYDLMRQMRASFLVLGPLLSRLGEAKVSLPGGCNLGSRPVDYHIKGFRQLGAEITEDSGYIVAKASKLTGTRIIFDRPSHTGTENIIFGAIFAEGTTTIVNAACDPEVVDVANFLNKAGAKIYDAGTSMITIEGVDSLEPVEYSVAGDRLVAGTFMCGAAITGGELEITGFSPAHLTMLSRKLYEMGCKITELENGINIAGPAQIKPVNAVTFPFPGFPTDLLPCVVAVSTVAEGTSNIRETVFDNRFAHTLEMQRLGAKIKVTGNDAIINGVIELNGASIMASDIRGGAGLVLAALAAKGESEILRVYHIDRGYYNLEEKLSGIGADIKRVNE